MATEHGPKRNDGRKITNKTGNYLQGKIPKRIKVPLGYASERGKIKHLSLEPISAICSRHKFLTLQKFHAIICYDEPKQPHNFARKENPLQTRGQKNLSPVNCLIELKGNLKTLYAKGTPKLDLKSLLAIGNYGCKKTHIT